MAERQFPLPPVPVVPAVGPQRPPQVALAANGEANIQPEVVQPAPAEPQEVLEVHVLFDLVVFSVFVS